MGKDINDTLRVIHDLQQKNIGTAQASMDSSLRAAILRGSDKQRAMEEWKKQPATLEPEDKERSIMALVRYINVMKRESENIIGEIWGRHDEKITFEISHKNPMLIEIRSMIIGTPRREYITTINTEEAYTIAKVRYLPEGYSTESYPNVSLEVEREVVIHLPEEEIEDYIGVKENEWVREERNNNPEDVKAATGEIVAYLQEALGYEVEMNGQAVIGRKMEPEASLREISSRKKGEGYTGVRLEDDSDRYGKYMPEARMAHEDAQHLYELIMKAYERILGFDIRNNIDSRLFEQYQARKGITQEDILKLIKARAVRTETIEKAIAHTEEEMGLTKEEMGLTKEEMGLAEETTEETK